MLVLSRGEAESFVLLTSDGPITVTVVRGGNRIRLGIDAPRCVPVVRTELLTPEQKQQVQVVP